MGRLSKAGYVNMTVLAVFVSVSIRLKREALISQIRHTNRRNLISSLVQIFRFGAMLTAYPADLPEPGEELQYF